MQQGGWRCRCERSSALIITLCSVLLALQFVCVCDAFSGITLRQSLLSYDKMASLSCRKTASCRAQFARQRSFPVMQLDPHDIVQGVANMAVAGAIESQFDAVAGVGLYALGQLTSGVISGELAPTSTLLRWMILGLFDGVSDHYGYVYIDTLSAAMAGDGLMKTAAMVTLSSVLYAPAFCLVFLIMQAIWEGQGMRGAVNKVVAHGGEMLYKSMPTWFVTNVIVFGCFGPEYRVIVAMLLHYLYLVALALWERSNVGGGGGSGLQQHHL